MTRSLRSSADISPKGEDLENHKSQALFAKCAFSLRCMFFFFIVALLHVSTSLSYTYILYIGFLLRSVIMLSIFNIVFCWIIVALSASDLALNVLVQAWTSYGPGPHVAP